MNHKKYFAKNKVKLTLQEKRVVKILGLLTGIQLQYQIPDSIIVPLERKIVNLLK